jgi:hypothetical protein
VILLLDTAGGPLREVPVTVSSVARTKLNDVAVSPSGVVCVTTTLVSADNRTTSAIFWIDKAGNIDKIVETAPFAASALAFADDGTLWAMGREYDADKRDKADCDVLRQYDPMGRLMRSALPKSSLSGRLSLGATLVAGQGRVGVLTQSEWVELSSSGAVLGRWPIRTLARKEQITGVAMGSSGQPWISIQTNVAPGAAETAGSGIFRLEPDSGNTIEVDSSAVRQSNQGIRLMNSETLGRLIVRVGSSIIWVDVN